MIKKLRVVIGLAAVGVVLSSCQGISEPTESVPEFGRALGNQKVTICHKGNTITVGAPAVASHLAHGDSEGACGGAPACVAPPAGLVGWWPFDESSGAVTADLAGPNDGGVIGAVFTPGFVGNALTFNGTSNQVVLPTITGFPLVDSPRTVIAWLNPSQNKNASRPYKPVFDYGDNSPQGHLFSVILSPSTAHGRCPAGALNRILVASWVDDICSAGAVTEDVWNHIAVVYRGGGDISFFIDGQHDSDEQFLGPLNTTHNFRTQAIGGRDFYVWYPGLIDEVAIFNRALADSEIDAIYDAGSEGMCK